MLGIIIGIASVLAIVTIGNALTASVNSTLSSFGTNVVTVNIREKSMNSSRNMMMFGGPAMGGASGGGGMVFRSPGGQRKTPENSDLISDKMISDFKSAFPNDISGIAVSYNVGSATAKSRDLYANISIIGTNPDYQISSRTELLQGRYISETDSEKNRSVCVVSDKFVTNIFPDESNPIGKEVKIYKTNSIEIYTIIGIYKYEESSFAAGDTSSDQDLSTNFYIPISTSLQGIKDKNYSRISVICAPTIDVLSFSKTMTSYFDNVYSKNATWGASITSMESQISTITDTLNMISMAIALIAAISLLVGGIGVMNIMLVSVTERTREIGTRKALGAKNFHIRFQFVTESVIISVIGGIIGILLGTGIGVLVSIIMNAPVTLSVPFILISVIFSMAIGIFFGYYPANKAAKLNPIDALRYE